MSAPFPDRDFLNGSWQSLDELARRTDAAFPVALPALSAINFDKVKDSICAYRGWGLYSVDAVTIAADGRIFLIEFKDTNDNPVAWLKKKGFDSLLLFWIAAGGTLSMDEIRDRAVFCYVSVPEQRYDDELGQDLEAAAGRRPMMSKPYQLDELRNSGLYGEVCHLDPSGFSTMIQNEGVASSVDELKNRIAMQYQPTRPRPSVAGPCGTSGDFQADVSPLAELRMPYPFDRTMHRKHPESILHIAETYDANAQTVSWKHDWHQGYPFMGLMACCFDSFALWALAYHSDKHLSDIGGELNATIGFMNKPLPSIDEPPNNSVSAYRHRFWEVYSPHYGRKCGLVVFEQECLYGHVDCNTILCPPAP